MMNSGEERERTAPFPGPNAPQRPQPYRFTPDELRVIKECNRESFYQRCLPFSAFFAGATYYGIQTGMLSRNKSFGAVPKVTAAVVMGFFLGKLSYRQKCEEKFMALPDSKIGRIIKARRLGIVEDGMDKQIGPTFPMSPFSGMPESYSDIPDTNKTYDYDSRPSNEGLDDSFRPSLDNPIVLHEEEMPPEQKHVTTYEELRKKNREEYEQKRLQSYRQLHTRNTPSPPTPPVPSEPGFNDDYKPPPSSGKNLYGDIWG